VNNNTFKAMKLNDHFDEGYRSPNFRSLISPSRNFGKYEELRYNYLKEYKKTLFRELLFQDKLNDHLAAVEQSARNRVDQIICCLLAKNPAPEKKSKPLEWVEHMNKIKAQANKIVIQELIYN